MPPQTSTEGKASMWTYVAALALVAVNLVPLVGVLAHGWSLFMVLLLFWFDNVAIGLFAVTRIEMAHLDRQVMTGRASPERRRKNAAGFAFAYFFFTMIHGLFLVLIFGSGSLNVLELGMGVLALFAGRSLDFYLDYLRPQAYLTADGPSEGGMALGRLIVLQFVILGGAFMIGAAKQAPVSALVLLVALKTAGDLIALYYENRPRPAPGGP